MRRRHWRQGKAVVLSPRHMEIKRGRLYSAGDGSSSCSTDPEYIRGGSKIVDNLIIRKGDRHQPAAVDRDCGPKKYLRGERRLRFDGSERWTL